MVRKWDSWIAHYRMVAIASCILVDFTNHPSQTGTRAYAKGRISLPVCLWEVIPTNNRVNTMQMVMCLQVMLPLQLLTMRHWPLQVMQIKVMTLPELRGIVQHTDLDWASGTGQLSLQFPQKCSGSYCGCVIGPECHFGIFSILLRSTQLTDVCWNLSQGRCVASDMMLSDWCWNCHVGWMNPLKHQAAIHWVSACKAGWNSWGLSWLSNRFDHWICGFWRSLMSDWSANWYLINIIMPESCS